MGSSSEFFFLFLKYIEWDHLKDWIYQLYSFLYPGFSNINNILSTEHLHKQFLQTRTFHTHIYASNETH